MTPILKTPLILILCLITSTILAQSSSEKAKEISEKVVKAMGGRDNYNNTHYIQWDFGKRKLFWNKWTGDVRVESPKDSLVILVNINSLEGKVFEHGNRINDSKKIEEFLQKGKNWWINDSYWLVMPWKLEDPGVTLSYLKTEKLDNDHLADVLELTFKAVGVTPDNKYHLYVDQTDNLIKQWAFFKNYNDTEPNFIRPWDNYQKVGNILLSFNRSQFGPKNVVVSQEFNSKLFTDLHYE